MFFLRGGSATSLYSWQIHTCKYNYMYCLTNEVSDICLVQYTFNPILRENDPKTFLNLFYQLCIDLVSTSIHEWNFDFLKIRFPIFNFVCWIDNDDFLGWVEIFWVSPLKKVTCSLNDRTCQNCTCQKNDDLMVK